MNIFKINSNPDLKVSCLKDEVIYNLEGNKVYKRSIYDFDNPLPLDLSIEDEIDRIYAVENLFIAICMNVVYVYEMGQLKSREILPGAIKKVRQNKERFLFLLENDKVMTFQATGFTTVILCKKSIFSKDADFVDFCVSGDFFFFLSSEGCVYRGMSRELILLSKPLKIIPEPSSTPYTIYYSSGRIFLGYSDGIEAYALSGDVLHLVYRYNTQYYKVVEGDGLGLYCLDKTVNLLGDYPGVVLNELVQYMLGNVCVSRDKIYVLGPQEEFRKETHAGVYSSCENVNLRIQNLFSDLRVDFNIDDSSTLDDFDRVVLNRYRKFYLELKTVNDTILKKKEMLDRLEKKILEKSLALEEKRNKLTERFRKLKFLENVKIDGSEIKKYVGLLEEKIKEKPRNKYEKYKSLLKTQRNLLIEKLTK